jgi:hypothetical protein
VTTSQSSGLPTADHPGDPVGCGRTARRGPRRDRRVGLYQCPADLQGEGGQPSSLGSDRAP